MACTRRRSLRALWVLGVVGCSVGLLVGLSPQASAHPSYGSNCSDCHSNNAKMSTTPGNGGVLKFGANGYTLVGKSSTADLTIADTSTGTTGGGFAGNFPAVTGPFSPNTTQALTTQYGGFLVGPTVAAKDGGVSSVTRTYTYTPTVRGVNTQSVTITPTDGFVSGTYPSSTITFSGQGVAPVISLVTPTANAGNVRIGTTGTASLKVANVGDGNLAGAGLGNLTGTMATGSNGFTGGGSFNLVDAGSQTFNYNFAPTTHGTLTSTIAVNATNGSTDGTNKAQSLSATLSGMGVGPTLNTSIAASSTIDFGQVAASQSALRSLTASNLTADADLGSLTNLDLISATITGPNAGMFSLSNFTPGTVLSKSQSTTLQLAFAPTSGATGTETATLTLVTDEGAANGAIGKSLTFSLTGVASGPAALTAAYWKGAHGGAWNSTASGYNWTTAADGATEVSSLPGAGTDVYFVASNPGTVNTTLGQELSVKSLNFTASATSPVTIGGSNTLTLANGITVASGSANHTINAKVQLGATQTWSVNGSSQLAVEGSISGAGNAGLNKDGSGTLVLSAANTYTGGTTVKGGTLQVSHADALPVGRDLTITGAGSVTKLASGPGNAVQVGALSIDGGSATPAAKLDLMNTSLVADKTLTSASAVRSQITTAYAGGTWTGAGITSSTAAADFTANGSAAKLAVGYADNADFGMGLTSFGGRTVTGNSLLFATTLYGDANLDGTVNDTDLGMLQHSFGMTGGATWDEGDFNFDGKVNLSDFLVLRANFSQTLTSGGVVSSANSSPVPEPASVTLLISAGLMLGGVAVRRYRRRDRVCGTPQRGL